MLNGKAHYLLELGETDISYDKITPKKAKQLEEPSTYKEYSNALPSMLCEFFQALIATLQDKERKQAIINKVTIKGNDKTFPR